MYNEEKIYSIRTLVVMLILSFTIAIAVGATREYTASYTPRFCERKLPESPLHRISPLLKVAVNQNTPASDASI